LPAALAGLLNQRASGGIDDARQVGQARSGLGFDNRADIGLAGVHARGGNDQIGEDAVVPAERRPGVHPRALAGAAEHLLYLPVGPGTNNLLVADDLVHLLALDRSLTFNNLQVFLPIKEHELIRFAIIAVPAGQTLVSEPAALFSILKAPLAGS